MLGACIISICGKSYPTLARWGFLTGLVPAVVVVRLQLEALVVVVIELEIVEVDRSARAAGARMLDVIIVSPRERYAVTVLKTAKSRRQDLAPGGLFLKKWCLQCAHW